MATQTPDRRGSGDSAAVATATIIAAQKVAAHRNAVAGGKPHSVSKSGSETITAIVTVAVILVTLALMLVFGKP